jgi:hypothetical protein
MAARPASARSETSRRLVVTVRSRAAGDVLEVSAETGGVLGSFDPKTGRLVVLESHDSVDVAAAVAPYLLAPDQPLGTLSPRHVEAAGRLWAILEASAFTWQRFVPLHDRLLLFYCPLVRLTLEIVEGSEHDEVSEREPGEDADAPALAQLGLFRASVPLADLEERPDAVAVWLSALCRSRADSRPGAKASAVAQRKARVRRAPRP